MPSLIDENTQFVDDAGLPIVAGKLYIGTQSTDPTLNLITIYSDRELTVSMANPQTLDADGRSTNKIWVPGKYSMRVDDVNDVQVYQELDNGETPQTGISLLENVQGADTITADGATTVSALVDKEIYIFTAASTNTTAVTLQIDAAPAKSVKKYHDVALAAGDIEADQVVMVAYNSTDDTFELASNPNSIESASFTVSLFDASTGGNTCNTTGTGYYTKVGNLVTMHVDQINNIDTSGMTAGNDIYFNLPVSPASKATGLVDVFTFTCPGAQTQLIVVISAGTQRGFIRCLGSGVAPDSLQWGNITTGLSDIINITVTYRA